MTPTSVQINDPVAPKVPLSAFQPRRYSTINPTDFAEPHVHANAGEMPDVDHMTWHFSDPVDADDHSLRLFLAFSAQELAIIERWGLDDQPIMPENVFSDAGIEQLKQAQEQELRACLDERVRGFLSVEHKQQLQRAREEKYEIRLSDFAANPFVKTFNTRWEATQARRNIEQKLSEFQKRLEDYRKRTYE